MTDYKPSDFYFSTPMMIDLGGGANASVVIISKNHWDSYHELQRGNQEAHGVRKCLNDILAEAEEGFFESTRLMDCQELSDRLNARGLNYNFELDSRLEEWAKDSDGKVVEKANPRVIMRDYSKNKINAGGYYFSTPFPGKYGGGFTDNLKVIIVPKGAYDKNGEWQDGGKEYGAMEVPAELSEPSENIFEAENPMSREEIEELLKNNGFIHNPKLDSDVMKMFGVPSSYYESECGRKVEASHPRPRVYITIGLPASGKSTHAKNFIDEARGKVVSRDLCGGSKAQARKKLEELLPKGGFVIIDDTNYSKEARRELIELVKKYNPVNITGIYMNVDKETCLERNRKREKRVPDIAIHTIAKRFEAPTLEEGFTDIMIFDKDGKGRLGK